MTITREQCRAARGLLDWSQAELAEAVGMTPETISNFESGAHKPYPRTLAAIQTALEAAGIVFMEENGAVGAILRPRDSGKE